MSDEVYLDTLESAPLRFGAERPHAKRISEIKHGHAYRVKREAFITDCRIAKRPCALCGEEMDYRLKEPHPYSPTLDHIKPVQDYPELIMEISNWQISHRDCNVRKGSDEPALDLGVPSELW